MSLVTGGRTRYDVLAMRIGAFEINEPVPELHEPHALVMIRPWVDVGSVGSLTLRQMERHFQGQQLGKLARPGTWDLRFIRNSGSDSPR